MVFKYLIQKIVAKAIPTNHKPNYKGHSYVYYRSVSCHKHTIT